MREGWEGAQKGGFHEQVTVVGREGSVPLGASGEQCRAGTSEMCHSRDEGAAVFMHWPLQAAGWRLPEGRVGFCDAASLRGHEQSRLGRRVRAGCMGSRRGPGGPGRPSAASVMGPCELR